MQMNEKRTQKEKYQVDLLSTEFKHYGDRIGQQLTLQHQIIQIGVTVLAVLVAAIASPQRLQEKPHIDWLLLSAPVVFSMLGLSMVARDETILELAGYQEDVLKPRLRSMAGNGVMSWHEYLMTVRYGRDRPWPLKVGKMLVGLFPHLIFLVIAWMPIVIIPNLYMFHHPFTLPSHEPAPYLNLGQRYIYWFDVFLVFWFTTSTILTTNRYRHIVRDTSAWLRLNDYH